MTFDEAVSQCALIAVLRGITPDEVGPVSTTLHGAGIRIVEVTLNSPEPYESIGRLAGKFGDRLVIGAGTVLSEADVNLVKVHGGRIAVAPDCNPAVIARALSLGLEPVPGVFTPTEAFTAIRAGARHLKFFPAEASTPTTLRAWRAVLPMAIKTYAVGGITPDNMEPWIAAGASGFGIGSNLYRPGRGLDEIAKAASQFVAGWRKATGRIK